MGIEAARVLVWNVEWARAGTDRGREIQRLVAEARPDIICLTEGYADLLPDDGQSIESDSDYGYRITEGRRKVILWSRTGWDEIDLVGDEELPSGRFVEGVTSTPAGSARVVGVCIPWRDAHVRTGRKDRQPWEDHRQYLRRLSSVLEQGRSTPSQIVVGDFNQRVPRSRQPADVFSELMATLGDRYSLATSGEIEGAPGLSIDHLAHTADVSCTEISVIQAQTEDGLRLSDHFGWIVDVEGDGGSRSV